MKERLLLMAVEGLLSVLGSDQVEDFAKEMADNVLDYAENKVLGTASPVDDALVLPICGSIRGTFNIPDNDG